MAFDCVCIDFKNENSKRNIENIKSSFPYAKVIPFVTSYKEIINNFIESSQTEYLWILTSLCDYSKFDFDYIPEQYEKTQIHTWAVEGQKEGDTFLIHKSFTDQKIKFLRDYKDVNYHVTNCEYDFNYDIKTYDLTNNFDLKIERQPNGKYFQYSETETQQKFFVSYWEDQKIYIVGKTFFIPYSALPDIKEQVYDYSNLYEVSKNNEPDTFDIAYISNGEPFEESMFKKLQQHIQENNLKNRLFWSRNVLGRSQAYKKAAEQSNTEYFYAVFAKSTPVDDFKFNYTVDRGKSKRHYIFHARLKELGLEYGTFNINLYNRSLCLETPDDVLDFTLHKKHEVVPIVINEALLSPDAYTGWKNAFREVSKLIYWNREKPTVENTYRIKKWKSTNIEWLARGAKDAEDFVYEINFSYEKLKQTYTWDFCRSRFKSLYPNETFY